MSLFRVICVAVVFTILAAGAGYASLVGTVILLHDWGVAAPITCVTAISLSLASVVAMLSMAFEIVEAQQ